MPNDSTTGRYYRDHDATVLREAFGYNAHGRRYSYLAFEDLYEHPVRMSVSTLAGESAVWLHTDLGDDDPLREPWRPCHDPTEHAVRCPSMHLGVDQACELIAGLARWMADGNLVEWGPGEGLGPRGAEVREALAAIAHLAAFVRDNTRWGSDPAQEEDCS